MSKRFCIKSQKCFIDASRNPVYCYYTHAHAHQRPYRNDIAAQACYDRWWRRNVMNRRICRWKYLA